MLCFHFCCLDFDLNTSSCIYVNDKRIVDFTKSVWNLCNKWNCIGNNGIFNKNRTLDKILSRPCFEGHILESTHAGDIPKASILERYYPLRGSVDTSLFVFKSFVAMLSTSSNWTAECVFAQHAYSNYAQPVSSPCVISESGEEKGRAEKWERGSNKLLIARLLGTAKRHQKTPPLKANNTSLYTYEEGCCVQPAQSQCLA